MNADQFRGRVEELLGRMEELAGWIFRNRPLIERGRVNLAVGQAQARFGDIKEVVRRRSEGRHDRPA